MTDRPKHLQTEWERLDPILQDKLDLYWQKWSQKHSALRKDLPDHPAFWHGLIGLWLGSHYLFQQTLDHPKNLLKLFFDGALFASMPEDGYYKALLKQTRNCSDTVELKHTLRVFKHQAMLRIGWRDLNAQACFLDTARDLSNLATACIQIATAWLERDMALKWGSPEAWQNESQSLVVIALGKLGGNELNVSSDIDLMFAYPQDGQTTCTKDTLSHQAFFTQVAQKLCSLFDDVTGDGRLYRVDIRLRPHGPHGPLVMSYQALDNYYRNQGQEWERYAMIKARALTGSNLAKTTVLQLLQAFTYRKYIDISALQSLRKLYKRIVKQHHQNDPDKRNIKCGIGGIRDVEFIIHSDQLINGGNRDSLRTPCLMDALNSIQAEGLMASETTKMLYRSYVFLRHIENRLQYIHNQQTHQLPITPADRAHLAYSMHFKSWEDLKRSLDHHRDRIHTMLKHTLEPPDTAPYEQKIQSTQHPILTALIKLYPQITEAESILDAMMKSIHRSCLSSHLETIATQLTGSLLEQALKQNASMAALAFVQKLLHVALNNRPYLMLLHEHHTQLTPMIAVAHPCPWIASEIEQCPALIAELIHLQRTLQSPLHLLALNNKLERIIQNTPSVTLEEQIENLMHFKRVHVFRVAVLYQLKRIDVMRVGDHLTNIASAIINHAFDLAKMHCPSPKDMSHDLGIIGYGKLGSIEMGFGSDLDLVFVYQTKKPKPTDITYYTQLYQTFLNIMAPAGTPHPLYTIDLRLRPMGKTGTLVHSLDTLETYLQTNAWTWEHQALIKARVIIGSKRLTSHFERTRQATLQSMQQSDEKKRSNIATMRHRMRRENRLSSKHAFDLKQSPGGIIDIEFITQHYTLKYSHLFDQLTHYTDNIRLLAALKQTEKISEKTYQILTQSYLALREQLLQNEMQRLPCIVDTPPNAKQITATVKLWQDLFEGAMEPIS